MFQTLWMRTRKFVPICFNFELFNLVHFVRVATAFVWTFFFLAEWKSTINYARNCIFRKSFAGSANSSLHKFIQNQAFISKSEIQWHLVALISANCLARWFCAVSFCNAKFLVFPIGNCARCHRFGFAHIFFQLLFCIVVFFSKATQFRTGFFQSTFFQWLN